MGTDYKITIRFQTLEDANAYQGISFYTCFNHLEDRGFATLTYDPHSKPLSMPKVDETSTSTEKNHHFEEQTNGSNPRKDRVEKSEGDHESPGHIFDSNGSAKVCDVNPIETRSPSSKSSPSISSGAKMSGRQYVLHRDIFQMRLQFHANLAAQRKTRQLLNSGKGLPSPPSKPLP
ncbi:fungal protein [Schizosaccharomyces cryophilus OY26]|uniref:Fungal protein n=1 Tax=Schizosaccharomyces cryophilus (strain OY26 / ATCC MYA-4695 / CBS 11777 / NBRC 106824 / NRRL Y48691) TaxID=653667 RepID=S9WWW2_SCHCR|nr:uncharacterized protein SPOG_04414 [Schizosaccharomyces cryophilus OY26]EPY49232.1 fungal protein [Schizosaccharomyces cryophilus OY26]